MVTKPVAEQETMMTLSEVAAYLRCSKRTMYAWLHDGKITGVKVGRRWLFDRDEVRKMAR